MAVRVEVRLGLAQVDPVVVRRVGVERAVTGGNQLREGFALDRDGAPGRDAVEDLPLEEVGAGVDLVGRLFARRRFLDEALDAAGRVVDDAAEPAGILDRDEVERADSALAAVVVQHGAQVERGQHVAVEDEERAADEALDVLERAGGAERRFFDDVADAQSELGTVAEVRRDRVGEVAGGQDDVIDPGVLEPAQRALQERHVHDGDHGLGRLERQRPKPRALTTNENDCLHEVFLYRPRRCERLPCGRSASRVTTCWHSRRVSFAYCEIEI